MKLVIFERVLTHYRLKFYNYLVENYNIEITFLTKEIPNSEGFKTNENTANFNIIKLKYYKIFGFEFYLFPLSILNSNNVFVCLLSFRSLPNSIYMFYRKIIGKKFYWWGHSRNFSKSSFIETLKDQIKGYLTLFSSGVLAYTEKEKARFQNYCLNGNKIVVLNNTVDTKNILNIISNTSVKEIKLIQKKYNLDGKFVIGLIGRLHKFRNTEISIKSILELNKSHKNLVLMIIGDGDEYKGLKLKYSKNSNIIFLGAIEDEAILAPIISNIKFFVNPGLVGLNITHTMIYGKPSVVIDKNYHSPEIDYLIPNFNGILTKNSFESFKDGINNLIINRDLLEKLSKNSFIYAKENLSIEKMGENFISILK